MPCYCRATAEPLLGQTDLSSARSVARRLEQAILTHSLPDENKAFR